MKRGYAIARVIRYLSETTGEVVERCVSQVRISCGIGRKQMESVVFDLKQAGIVLEVKRGKHRILIPVK